MEVHVRALQLFPTQWDPFDKVIPVSPFPFRFINYVSYNESEKRQIIRVLHTCILPSFRLPSAEILWKAIK